MTQAVVSNRGVARWTRGHPWIFTGDVVERPSGAAGVVTVRETSGRVIGDALFSPHSEITLRMLTRGDVRADATWFAATVAAAVQRRASLDAVASAYRLIHGEGDGVPSFVADRYDRWIVVQLLSAGLESQRSVLVEALRAAAPWCEGILARHDVPVRNREKLSQDVEVLWGDVPREIAVQEHGVTYLAAPWDGQKTGAFLDQREHRALIGGLARGRGLDCFSYHGSFALHMARRCESVLALDVSAPALERAVANAARNGLTNVVPVVADAFEELKRRERLKERFETIVVDPPAFAKNRSALANAVRGYHEVNLRAMRLLAPGGTMLTASCSFHLSKPDFLAILEGAAKDSGRRMALRALTAQGVDHPELLTVPETGYLKGAVLVALD
ncbi:MAG: class I SAM-dependent rRNA methyltransferase [Gemmatimonadaceae bacterium]|nr:class I SAM-dependent rRNA methyltransferase [Gemmatimonadaceae bacterium]